MYNLPDGLTADKLRELAVALDILAGVCVDLRMYCLIDGERHYLSNSEQEKWIRWCSGTGMQDSLREWAKEIDGKEDAFNVRGYIRQITGFNPGS